MYVLPLTCAHDLWEVTVRIRLWIQAAEFFVKDEGSALEIERYYFCCYTLSLEILSSFSWTHSIINDGNSTRFLGLE